MASLLISTNRSPPITGLKALELFTTKRPLRDVHERVLGFFPMDGEPVHPRLKIAPIPI